MKIILSPAKKMITDADSIEPAALPEFIDKTTEIFELTEDGRLAAVEWIRQQYESRLDYWEAAPSIKDAVPIVHE